eukprot:scaffold12889_cov159-Ochromonas_danica.AAC.2
MQRENRRTTIRMKAKEREYLTPKVTEPPVSQSVGPRASRWNSTKIMRHGRFRNFFRYNKDKENN